MNLKACVLIPSFNEEKTVGHIVKKVKRMGLEVIVIDDGSEDNTEEAASGSGAIVVRHIKNIGKGASLKKGFDFILKTTDFEAVIVMDGDGQHDPRDLEKFISCAAQGRDDIIVGNRMNYTKNMPFVRKITNRFMSRLLSKICRQNIPDTQCGFKLIKRPVLEKIELDSNNYDFDSEILLRASREHFRIGSVPVETIYRGETSKINPVIDTFRFIKLLLWRK